MVKYKGIKNVLESKYSCVCDGQQYVFEVGEKKLLPEDVVKFLVGNSQMFATGEAHLVVTDDSEVTEEMREVLKNSSRERAVRYLIYEGNDSRFECMYNAIVYTFEKGISTPVSVKVAEDILRSSYSESSRTYRLKECVKPVNDRELETVPSTKRKPGRPKKNA